MKWILDNWKAVTKNQTPIDLDRTIILCSEECSIGMVGVHQDHNTETHHLPQGDAHCTQTHYTWLISRLDPWKPCQLACPWWPRKMLPICMVGRRRLQAARSTRLHTIPLAIICSSLAIRFPSKLKSVDGPGPKDVPSLLFVFWTVMFPSPIKYCLPISSTNTYLAVYSKSRNPPWGQQIYLSE